MRLIKLSMHGYSHATASKVDLHDGRYFYAIHHGEAGRNRWAYRIPLGFRDFPCYEGSPQTITLDRDDYVMVDLHRDDRRGNPIYLIGLGESSKDYLVMWSLHPGHKGGADYEVDGDAEVIATGVQGYGKSGRKGSSDCPVVYVTDYCTLSWHRYGVLNNRPADWVAVFSGDMWRVMTEDEFSVESEIFI